jgi:hypothetical protein
MKKETREKQKATNGREGAEIQTGDRGRRRRAAEICDKNHIHRRLFLSL